MGEVEGNGSIYHEIPESLNRVTKKETRTELQYKSVVEHSLDPIITIDSECRMIYANRAVYTTFGHRFQELVDYSILDLVGQDRREDFQLFLSRAFKGELMEIDHSMIFHKQGHLLPLHVKAIPIARNGSVQDIHLILRDLSALQAHNEKLLYLSYHDPLTGLWNRQAIKEHFGRDSIQALDKGETLSLIHVNLDRFKLINESLGHNGGDKVLKMIAERLKAICPVNAKLYRYDGDEFIVSLDSEPVSELEQFAQELLAHLGQPFYINQQEYFLSASIGIVMYPENGSTLEELLRKSEQAFTFVKEQGRANYRFYQEEMDLSFPDEALMESHLRRAIELDELVIHYQPQVDLKSGHIVSFEALLRWNNRKFGFVSPMRFIPIAEESGLIHGIGDWVLSQVCKQLREWRNEPSRSVRIAVNISAKQFKLEDFTAKVKSKISYYAIDPSSLEVEITESALTNRKETLRTLHELKNMGVSISVDDFGTGYSSLSYLKQYPIDIIKIDRSFIQDIETDVKNEAIAKTIINLAHNLGMTVVAEGVEKDSQAKILLESNCQKAQGYLYSKAVPIEEIVEKYLS